MAQDVEHYFPDGDGAGGMHHELNQFNTGIYGYERHQGSKEVEAAEEQQWTDGDGHRSIEPGYEGWEWHESSGWHYNEELAGKQTVGQSTNPSGRAALAIDVADPDTPSSQNGSGASDDDESDGSESSDERQEEDGLIGQDLGEERGRAGGRRSRKKRRRRAPPPREYPRSKAQRLVDEAEDSVDGVHPELLDLSRLGMERVTSRVYDLEWLQKLDLSNNCLSRISPDMARMTSVREVNLRHNRIETIPDDLEALTQLKHLRLGHNQIKSFRGNIYLTSSLETLDLEHNRIEEMPLQVGDLQLLKRTREWEVGVRLLKELRTLDLSHNLLSAWPAQVDGCRLLQTLRLGYNQLVEVPDLLGDNSALTHLDLAGNRMKAVPDTLNSLTSLTFLDLSKNELETLSILEIGRKQRGPRLISLETLRAGNNLLTAGPTAIETLTTLTELDLSHNPMAPWTPNLARMRKISHLRLGSAGLDRCPVGIGELIKLETLDLSGNNIKDLDRSAANLFKLKRLSLQGNAIKELGPAVGSMLSLTHLDVGGNGLEVLSPACSRCTALEYLDLSSGTLEALPIELSKLGRLRRLRAQDHNITFVPPQFASLSALEELRLDGNRLSSLPQSLHTLSKMRFADLSRNVIESPPAVTREWPLLTHMVLSRNPLKGRQAKPRSLLQAAHMGHRAMRTGDWENAVRHLDTAAQAYDDVLQNVPDFPDVAGQGPPLMRTRPHDAHSFHHTNLGLAHLERARAVAAYLQEMDTMAFSSQANIGSSAGVGSSVSATSQAETTDDGSSMASLGTTEREDRRRKELEIVSARQTRDHQYQAAAAAYDRADQIEQLSRPVGRSAAVALGRAAVAVDAGNPADAVHDLESALGTLQRKAGVRASLAKSRIELGQYQRGLTDCCVASRWLTQKEKRLDERQAEQAQREEVAAADEKKAADLRRAKGRMASRTLAAGEVSRSPGADTSARAADATSSATATEITGESHQQNGLLEPNTVTETPRDDTTKNLSLAEAPTLLGESDHQGERTYGRGEGTASAEMNSAKVVASKKLESIPLTERSQGEEDLASTTVDAAAFNPERFAPGGNGDFSNRGMYTEAEDREVGKGVWPLQDSLGPGARTDQMPSATTFSGGRQQEKTSDEREVLAKLKGDLAKLLAHGQEGLLFVQQSVDLADLLRGFSINPHGVPVRDMAFDRGRLLQGRSVFRDRLRRLRAVEAAKERDRARDAALVDRSLRQIATRRQAIRLAKARKEAAMTRYREAEDAWERKQDDRETARRIAAAKTKTEDEVKAKAAAKAAASAAEGAVRPTAAL